MKVELSTLITQYYELGGKDADAASPKLNREELLAVASGSVPAAASGPNLRALRAVIEKRAKSEHGIKLDLRASTLNDALEKIAEDEQKPIVGLSSSTSVWTPADIDRAVQEGHLDAGKVGRLLTNAYLGLLSEGQLRDAAAFKGRFSGQLGVSTDDEKAATALATASRHTAWEDADTIVSMHAAGAMTEGTYVATLKAAYLHTLGYMSGHFDDALKRYNAELASFAPYEHLFTVTEAETHAALRSLIGGAADWNNTSTAAEVSRRLDFIAARRSPGDEAVMSRIFTTGAAHFVDYGYEDKLVMLEGRTDMLDQEGRATFVAARSTAYATAKEKTLAKLAQNDSPPFACEVLSLLQSRQVITPDEFKQGLSRYYELELSEASMHSYWSDAAYEDAKIVRLDQECREAAKAANVEWEPPTKCIRADGKDVAPAIRDGDYDIDTPAFRAMRASLVEFLPPYGTESEIVGRFRQFLEHAEAACTDTQQTWRRPSPRFAPLKETTRAELAEYASAIGEAIGRALGKNVSVTNDKNWDVSVRSLQQTES